MAGPLSSEDENGLLVGITGGIATGKSRVAEYLARRGGFARLDTDRIARRLLAPGQPGWLALNEHYGRRYFDATGQLDRPLLRRAIFGDAVLRAAIDRLLHPLIRRAMQVRAGELFRAGAAVVLVEVPLLYEAGWQDDFDLVLAVAAAPELCRQRLRQRDRVGRREADQAVAAQLAPAEKARRADWSIDNSGAWSQTRGELDRLLPWLRERAVAKAGEVTGEASKGTLEGDEKKKQKSIEKP